MSHLGNRITLHSPSRGFSMELGSAITIILATRLSTYKTFDSLWLCFLSLLPAKLNPSSTVTNQRLPQRRASRLYYPVHHRRHRRRWPLRRHLADDQLADGLVDLCGLDHHSSHRRYHLGLSNGVHYQRPALGLLGLDGATSHSS